MEIIEFNGMDNFLPSVEKARMLNLLESPIIIEQKEKNSLIFKGIIAGMMIILSIYIYKEFIHKESKKAKS
jgi:hypothetical protein